METQVFTPPSLKKQVSPAEANNAPQVSNFGFSQLFLIPNAGIEPMAV
jgi:hypothetical protein